ncbi:MAG: hypothetical protein KDB01_08635 [Planctomycetaceae bacterium]|nr:hypothetical protein [Planctomycetaceae bacterium]
MSCFPALWLYWGFTQTSRMDAADMLICAPLIAAQNKVLIYHGVWDGPQNSSQNRSGIGLATLLKDGFVLLGAGEVLRTVRTRLLNESSQPAADQRRHASRFHLSRHAGLIRQSLAGIFGG